MEHLGNPNQPVGPLPELVWLRKTIIERAITRGDYVLSGGVRSDYYIDKFRLFSDPNVLRRIARLFTPLLTEFNPDLIAGTELGGVVVATASNRSIDCARRALSVMPEPVRELRAMLVATPPGCTTESRTGLAAVASSCRKASEKPRTANFAAA